MEIERCRFTRTRDETLIMRFSLFFAGALTVALSLHAGSIGPSGFTSGATLINFDDLTGGDCNLCGPSVTDQYAAQGVTFNNPTYPGQDTADDNLTSLVPGASSPNMLYVFQGGLISSPIAQPFQILFSVPVNMAGFVFGSSADSFLEISAYSASDQLLETIDYVGTSAPIGLAGFAGIEESTPIAELDVSYHPNSDASRTFNFSIDNLVFQASSVPEPGTILCSVPAYSE